MAGGTGSRLSGEHLPDGRQNQATIGWMSFCPLTQLHLASSCCCQYPPMSPTDTNGQQLNPSTYSKWKEIAWRKKKIVLCGCLLNTALHYIRTFSYKYLMYATFIPAIHQSPLPPPIGPLFGPMGQFHLSFHVTCTHVILSVYK